ncbi:energy transducer TonB [Pedobacter frigiditerrae]|uniref:Energy transducer TonB n=1 Tax=Pedobacter frigiditerrae TaxID=2530452 RepID=A0A4V2MHL0_9SPHI|nr:energy transducer TonB [Pedobacter frigiditerrae]TCC86906.1 energy transducer TonB [Pedobacter frigiditerrae]
MKIILLLLLNLVISLHVSAQQKIVRLKLDTINVSGRLIAGDGSNLANVYIETKSQHNQYLQLKVGATTDSLGNFKLVGIKPTDTLTFFALNNDHIFVNHGTRFLNITVWPSMLNYNKDAITVSANRTSKKETIKFKLTYLDNIGCCNISANSEYPGGERKFKEYIYQNLKYPLNAINNNIEGTVTVEFTIAKDGTLLFPKIINGLGFGCDEAVLEILKHSRKWIPGMKNGRPIVMSYQTDVVFKLVD